MYRPENIGIHTLTHTIGCSMKRTFLAAECKVAIYQHTCIIKPTPNIGTIAPPFYSPSNTTRKTLRKYNRG